MPAVSKSKYLVTMTWDDAPHLDDDVKEALWDSIPPYQREARSKGVPSLGSGAIYPVPESDIKVDPFQIPEFWPKCFGMDVGWKCTAAIWLAHDRENDMWYLYHEYARGQAEPVIHAEGIKAPGHWIPGAIDPASRGRAQRDGEQLFENYINLGLNITKANNGVEAGLMQIWGLLSTGRLKVFSTCQKWFEEYRIYRRDEQGKIVKENDHLMDCTRYGIVTGRVIASQIPYDDYEQDDRPDDTRNDTTGY